jgi:hypothetical protein
MRAIIARSVEHCRIHRSDKTEIHVFLRLAHDEPAINRLWWMICGEAMHSISILKDSIWCLELAHRNQFSREEGFFNPVNGLFFSDDKQGIKYMTTHICDICVDFQMF